MTNRTSLATLMNGLQSQLVHILTHGREVLPHPTEVGDNAELHWIDMLSGFLPRRYAVAKAFVIDVNGTTSEQLDVVIYDRQYSPQIFQNVNGTVYIPAESVYAVFDAKQDLHRDNVIYASNKVGSVRRMERTTSEIPYAGGIFRPKDPPRILGGILTLGSDWNPPFGDPLLKALRDAGDEETRLDIGCAAANGAFRVVTGDDIAIDVWDSAAGALVWFVTRLLAALQAMATVPAIDINRWADIALAEGLPAPIGEEE
ncbi:MAG: hypothetical protein KY395_05420 [Actinobacteria bacterium]|nr:hypothetical protein [Actinomycetota bacterium]